MEAFIPSSDPLCVSTKSISLRIVWAAPGVSCVRNGRCRAARNVTSNSAVRVDECVPVGRDLHRPSPVADANTKDSKL